MKILITGAEGMLGRTLQKKLSEHQLFLPNRSVMDVTCEKDVRNCFEFYRPDAVIHCAAMTAVDDCETEKDSAWKTNAWGTRNVAVASEAIKARLINISTDYVFDGKADRPYTEFDFANGGATVYGQTKFAAEQYVSQLCSDFINLRISWLYGEGGPSFVHTMLALSRKRLPSLKVVDDQVGNPTSTHAVALTISKLLKVPGYSGTIHATCEGETSWYGFAKKIFELKGIEQRIEPCTSEDFPRPAKRPKNSRLEKRVLKMMGLPERPGWEEALSDFLSKDTI